jgi:integrase
MGKRKAAYVWTDPKTGYIYGRIQIKGANGKYKPVYTDRARNTTHAAQLALELKDEYKKRGQAYLDGRNMTLSMLAEWYKENYVTEAIYIDGKKVSGMRTWKAERNKIDAICKEIGHHLINDITEEVLRAYKIKRLKSKVKISTVNRDLEAVRAMIYKAIKRKWRKDPLDFDEVLDKSLESRRTATITDEQEARILKAAHGMPYSKRIYALILALRDSGARPSELYPVNDFKSDYSDTGFYEPIRWRDIFEPDFTIRDITIFVSYKGKQREERLGIISERMKVAFLELWEQLQRGKHIVPGHAANLDNLIFPHKSYQTAWEIVRVTAGVPTLRLRDLRRDWVTRLARKGYSDKLAQRGAGHKTMQMSFEYTEFNMAAALEAKNLIDLDNISEAVN